MSSMTKTRTSGDDQRADDRSQRERTTAAESTAEMQHGEQQRRQHDDVTERVQSLRRFVPVYRTASTYQ